MYKRAYLIGGDFDLTVLSVSDDRPVIQMSEKPRDMPSFIENTHIMATVHVLIYKLQWETNDGALIYEYQRPDQ